jgi:hypothetical protein
MNIENILQRTTDVLCQSKLYKNRSFLDTPHKKIMYKAVKDITGLSYKKIGEHFKQSWFAIYKSCKDIETKEADFYSKIIKEVKKVI